MATDCTLERVKYQWTATIIANLICLGQGAAIGWLSPTMPLWFDADRTPLRDGIITQQQAGWIGALLSIGGMSGTFTMGLLTQVLGTRRTLLICVGPLLVSWVLVYYSQFVWQLYLARICVGFTCGGVFVCNALYVSEIASDRIRGRLCALLTVGFNAGILLGYVGGTYLDYRSMPLAMAVLPAMFTLMFAFVPDTPQFLLQTRRTADAEQSLRFYRDCRSASDKQQELVFWSEFHRLQAIAAENGRTKVELADFRSKDAIRGLIIGPTLLAVSQFSGSFTLSNYASTIFSASHSSIDPNHSAIVLGILQICGTCCTSVLIDRWGRKRLLLLSTIGCTLLLSVTGLYEYMHADNKDASPTTAAFDGSWLPVCTLSLFVFIAALGIVPVPYVMVAEILPQKIRSIGATICTTSVSVFSFTILKCFPMMLGALGLHGCLAVFAAVSAFGVVFTALAVTETSGRSLEVLHDEGDVRSDGEMVVESTKV